MATNDYTLTGAWQMIASAEGPVVLTSHTKDARIVTAVSEAPDFDPAIVGHILPERQTITVVLSAADTLWACTVGASGHLTVTTEF